MSLPLALVAHLALRRASRAGPSGPAEDGAGSAAAPPPPPRPAGRLIWLHAASPGIAAEAQALATRLSQDKGAGAVLLTGAGGLPPRDVIAQPAPTDTRAAARAFLAHWQPGALVWLGLNLAPALLAEASEAPMQRLLFIGAPPPGRLLLGGWMPGLGRALLRLFDLTLAEDGPGVEALTRAGARRAEAVGVLATAPPLLPSNFAEQEDLAQALGPRPIWLVAGARAAEVAQMAEAQRHASRASHRLLMVLVPKPGEGAAVTAAIRAQGFDPACRAEAVEPNEATEVCIAESESELGLWYRLAPLTFVGGTLAGGLGRHPYEPAAMGSAVLHGPLTAPHEAAYRRLAQAGASRVVTSGAELGRMIEALLAPDKAAAMAHAAWGVTSEGAAALDAVAARLTALYSGAAGVALPVETG